jgi:hypothetical protein
MRAPGLSGINERIPLANAVKSVPARGSATKSTSKRLAHLPFLLLVEFVFAMFLFLSYCFISSISL